MGERLNGIQEVIGSIPIISTIRDTLGGIAQMGERLNGIQEVIGSIPIISTNENTEALASVFFSARNLTGTELRCYHKPENGTGGFAV